MSAALNGTTVALSLISAVFFIVGSIGYADIKSPVKSTAWIISSNDGLDVHFGLRKAFAHYDNFGIKFDSSIEYNSGFCTDSWCDNCNSDGKGTVGLTIIALIFTMVTLSFSCALLATKNRSVQISNVLMSFFAAFSSLVGVSLFMSDCYTAINDLNNNDDDYDDNYDDDGLFSLKWGPGAIVTLVGMLLMWIVVVLQIVAVVTGA
jgi:hypothetical protein